MSLNREIRRIGWDIQTYENAAGGTTRVYTITIERTIWRVAFIHHAWRDTESWTVGVDAIAHLTPIFLTKIKPERFTTEKTALAKLHRYLLAPDVMIAEASL